MISDIWTVMRKEFKEILLQRGTRRAGIFLVLLFPAIFGIFIPIQTGALWVKSPIVLFYSAWLPFILVTTVIADSFAGERERHTLETLLASRLSDRAILFGKVLSAVAYGWCMILGILVLGLISVNAVHGHGKLLVYPGQYVAGAVVGSLLVSCFTASVGVLISLRAATVRQAGQFMSVLMIIVFFVPVLGLQLLPDALKKSLFQVLSRIDPMSAIIAVGAALIALNLLLLAFVLSRFQRARLILD